MAIVADTPQNVAVTRLNTGLTHLNITWSTVVGVKGYEVFYQQLNSNIVVSSGTAIDTLFTISSGLKLKYTYGLFIVAYGSKNNERHVLPSPHSDSLNISLGNFTLYYLAELLHLNF